MNESKAMLDRIEAALEQAQDCIKGETPEDVSDEEAREDTISKIRAALFDDISALRASAPQEDGRALEPVAWQFARHDGKWFNCDRAPTPEQLAEKPHVFRPLYAAPPSVALEADLTDDQIMEILRRVTKDELYEMLTCKRWKDGIDITGPTYAAERLAKEFRAALTRPQPGGAVAGTERGGPA